MAKKETQLTRKGVQIPTPGRSEFFKNLKKATKPSSPPGRKKKSS